MKNQKPQQVQVAFMAIRSIFLGEEEARSIFLGEEVLIALKLLWLKKMLDSGSMSNLKLIKRFGQNPIYSEISIYASLYNKISEIV